MKLKQFLNEKDIVSANELYSKEELLKKMGFEKIKKINDKEYEVWGNFEGNPKDIPFKIKILHGKLNFSFSTNLTSLKGSPEIVDGNFYCFFNKNLKSLKGGPKKINGDFQCSGCDITSLRYGPEFVGKKYDCSYNNLTSLKGCVEIVNGTFSCNNNKLTTLEYCPKIVKSTFFCQDNSIPFKKEYVKSICQVEGSIEN